MTNQEIINHYDSNLNITLKELSDITGKPIKVLKTILMNDEDQPMFIKVKMINNSPFYCVWHSGSIIKQYGTMKQALAYINTF